VLIARTKVYLALEYANGGDMLAYVNSRKLLSEPEAAAIFAQVIDGIKFCHGLGVCHRDLKLENLLLCDGVVKIADFGLANYSPPSMAPGESFMQTHCGSPLYAAPELLRNTAAYDAAKVDIWSLGVVLYALVCRKLPFEGDGLPAILKKIVAADYAIPSTLSLPLVDLLKKMLSVDPALRPTADEVATHEWLTSNAATATEPALERSNSMDELSDEIGALRSGSNALVVEEPKRRPTTMSAGDIKRSIAEAVSAPALDSTAALASG
jgi:serine/threonine protein kinase